VDSIAVACCWVAPQVMSVSSNGISGTVRRYNGSKGYGFLIGPDPWSDVMFSRNELPEDAREMRGQILEGRPVEFDAQFQGDGRTKALSVRIPYVEGQKCPGMIKSFSERNGFGFATSSCLDQDVYFKTADFQPAQVFVSGANLSGALVLIEVEIQPDGKVKATKIQFQTAKIAERYTQSGSQGLVGGRGATFNVSMGGVSGGAGVNSMMNGTVKSYNAEKGFGFITVPGMSADLRFGRRDIDGGYIDPGTPVQFVMILGSDGRLQAQSVMSMGLLTMGGSKRDASWMSHGDYWSSGPPAAKQLKAEVPVTTTGRYISGTVKSYNPTKGWGLISSPEIPSGGSGTTGDVFFMKSNLPQEVRDHELKTYTVNYELVQTPDGKYRAQNITIA